MILKELIRSAKKGVFDTISPLVRKALLEDAQGSVDDVGDTQRCFWAVSRL